MGNLNNLYISQSYQSLLHFATDSGSTATLTEIEDGTGQGLGLYLNSIGSASLDGDMFIGGDLTVSGAFDIEGPLVVRDNVYVTGSIYSSQNISSSRMLAGEITASNLRVEGTLYAYEIHTIIESSSVIFSSGSNILGDSLLDTQTLNGTVIVSGSEQVTGSLGVSNNVEVKGNISSSTVSGIGNVTAYSQSVDARLDIVEATASLYVPFSQSVDSRLDYLEATASYLNGPFSTSVDARLDSLEQFTGSQGLVTTSSFQAYTASVNADLAAIHQTTASLNAYTASNTIAFNTYTASAAAAFNAYTSSTNSRLNNLELFSGSQLTKDATLQQLTSSVLAWTASTNTRLNIIETTYATTGSNTFRGTESIEGSLNITGSLGVSGSMVYSGSVRGQVFPITIASQTASLDCSLGNFFTLTLVSGSATNLQATNIKPGETISLRITQPVGGYGSVTTNGGTIRFPQTSPYFASPSGSAVDIISFLSFDTSALYGVSVNTMR